MNLIKSRLLLIFDIIVFNIGAICYFLSLEGGDEDWLHENLLRMTVLVIVTAALWNVSFWMLVFATFTPPLKLALLLYHVLAVSFLFLLDQGTTPYHHGSYNSFMLMVVLVPSILLVGSSVYSWKYILSKTSLRVATLIAVLVFVVPYLLLRHHVSTSSVRAKERWTLGLGGERMQLESPQCSFHPPDLSLVDSTMKFTSDNQKCDAVIRFSSVAATVAVAESGPVPASVVGGETPSYTLKVRCHSTPVYRFFARDKNESITRLKEYEYQQAVLNSTVIISTDKVVPFPSEFSVVRIDCGSDTNMHIHPEVRKPEVVDRVYEYFTKNGSHSSKNPKSSKENHYVEKERSRVNVELLLIDALSRRHFFRRMGKSAAVLEKLKSDSNFEVLQFFKFHSVGVATSRNIKGLFLGRIRVDQSEFIWEKMRKIGYVSAFAEESCQSNSADFFDESPPTGIDHYFSEPFCDTSYRSVVDPYSTWKGPYSMFRRCLHGDFAHNYLFQYLNNLAHSYWVPG